MNFQSKIILELHEEAEAVNFYTIRFKAEEDSEFDKFIKLFMRDAELRTDLIKIVAWIDKIGKQGALERHFRNESKFGERVKALPIETSKLRLYCLRISDNILILGNGGHKKTRTYNEDPLLNKCVEALSGLSEAIRAKTKSGEVAINGKNISGDMSFTLQTKHQP